MGGENASHTHIEGLTVFEVFASEVGPGFSLGIEINMKWGFSP
jgi:hypothetical protein